MPAGLPVAEAVGCRRQAVADSSWETARHKPVSGALRGGCAGMPQPRGRTRSSRSAMRPACLPPHANRLLPYGPLLYSRSPATALGRRGTRGPPKEEAVIADERDRTRVNEMIRL